MENKDYVSMFIRSISKMSDHTIKYYERVLSGHVDINGNVTTVGFKDFVGKPLDQVSKMDIILFKQMLEDKGMAESSINTYLMVLQSFYNFIIKKCGVKMEENPAAGESIKLGKRHTDFLQDDEVEKIIKASRSKFDRAFVMGLASTGLRFSELSSIVYAQIERFEEDGQIWGKVNVIGKGNKERTAFIPPVVVKAFDEYYNEERPETDCEHMFVNREGRELDNYSSNRKLQSLAKKAGIKNPERVHNHLFRHSFATSALRNKVDIRVIQSMLGHSDISTTQRYAHTDDEMIIGATKLNKLFQ